jgi:hypothetical protein
MKQTAIEWLVICIPRLYFYTGRLFFRKQTNNDMTQTLIQLLKDA